MHHTMAIVMVLGGVVMAWAILRVIGGERERQVRELTWKIAASQSAVETPSKPR